MFYKSKNVKSLISITTAVAITISLAVTPVVSVSAMNAKELTLKIIEKDEKSNGILRLGALLGLESIDLGNYDEIVESIKNRSEFDKLNSANQQIILELLENYKNTTEGNTFKKELVKAAINEVYISDEDIKSFVKQQYLKEFKDIANDINNLIASDEKDENGMKFLLALFKFIENKTNQSLVFDNDNNDNRIKLELAENEDIKSVMDIYLSAFYDINFNEFLSALESKINKRPENQIEKFKEFINDFNDNLYTGKLDEETSVFDDLGNHKWAEKIINKIVSKGIMKGKAAKLFAPQDNITRAEFATIVVKAYELELNNTIQNPFEDVGQDDWFYNYVLTAYSYNVISGIDSDTFDPNASIKREDMAVIILNILDAVNIDIESLYDENTSEVNFYDNNKISDYAKDAVEKTTKAGILNGYPNGRFKPQEGVSRAEAAIVIYKIYNLRNID